MEKKRPVYQILAELSIPYRSRKHPPVDTAEAAERHLAAVVEGARCKNLFLRNPKGSRHFLVIVDHGKTVDLKSLAAQLGESRLGFASAERLARYLGLTPGSVTPFGLLNDLNHEVVVVVDEAIRQAEQVNFHPNSNNETLTIAYRDFEKFVHWQGNPLQYVRL